MKNKLELKPSGGVALIFCDIIFSSEIIRGGHKFKFTIPNKLPFELDPREKFGVVIFYSDISRVQIYHPTWIHLESIASKGFIYSGVAEHCVSA